MIQLQQSFRRPHSANLTRFSQQKEAPGPTEPAPPQVSSVQFSGWRSWTTGLAFMLPLPLTLTAALADEKKPVPAPIQQQAPPIQAGPKTNLPMPMPQAFPGETLVTQINQAISKVEGGTSPTGAELKEALKAFDRSDMLRSLSDYATEKVQQPYMRLLETTYLQATKADPKDTQAVKVKTDIQDRLWEIILCPPASRSRPYEVLEGPRGDALTLLVHLQGKDTKIPKERLSELLNLKESHTKALLPRLSDSTLNEMGGDFMKTVFVEYSENKANSGEAATQLSHFFKALPLEKRQAILAKNAPETKALVEGFVKALTSESPPRWVLEKSQQILSLNLIAALPANSYKAEWKTPIQKLLNSVEKDWVDDTHKRQYYLEALSTLGILELKKDSGCPAPMIYPDLLRQLKANPNDNWAYFDPPLLHTLAGEAVVNHQPPQAPRVGSQDEQAPYGLESLKMDAKLFKPLETLLIDTVKQKNKSSSLDENTFKTALKLMQNPYRQPESLIAWQTQQLNAMINIPVVERIRALTAFSKGLQGSYHNQDTQATVEAGKPMLRKMLNQSAQLLIDPNPAQVEQGLLLFNAVKNAYPWPGHYYFPQDPSAQDSFKTIFKHLQTTEITAPRVLTIYNEVGNASLYLTRLNSTVVQSYADGIRGQLTFLKTAKPTENTSERQIAVMEGIEKIDYFIRLFHLSDEKRLEVLSPMYLDAADSIFSGTPTSEVIETGLRLFRNLNNLDMSDAPKDKVAKAFIQDFALPVLFKKLMVSASKLPERERGHLSWKISRDMHSLMYHAKGKNGNLHFQDGVLKIYADHFLNPGLYPKEKDSQENLQSLTHYLANGGMDSIGFRSKTTWSESQIARFAEFNNESLNILLQNAKSSLKQGKEDEQIFALSTITTLADFNKTVRKILSEPQTAELSPERIQQITGQLEQRSGEIRTILQNRVQLLTVTLEKTPLNLRLNNASARALIDTLHHALASDPALASKVFDVVKTRLADAKETDPYVRGTLYRLLGELPANQSDLPVLKLLEDGIIQETSGVTANGIGEAFQQLWLREMAGKKSPETLFAASLNEITVPEMSAAFQKVKNLNRLLQDFVDRKDEAPDQAEQPVTNTLKRLLKYSHGSVNDVLSKMYDVSKLKRDPVTRQYSPEGLEIYRKARKSMQNMVANSNVALAAFAIDARQSAQHVSHVEKDPGEPVNSYKTEDWLKPIRFQLQQTSSLITQYLEKSLYWEFHFAQGDIAASLIRLYQADPTLSQEATEAKLLIMQERLFHKAADSKTECKPIYQIINDSFHESHIRSLIGNMKRPNEDTVKKLKEITNRLQHAESCTDADERFLRDLDSDAYYKNVTLAVQHHYSDFVRQFLKHTVLPGSRSWRENRELLEDRFKVREHIFQEAYEKLLE